MKTSIILNTDSYKPSMYQQLPENTTEAYGYIESRVGGMFDYCVFMGLQLFLMEHMSSPITQEEIDEAESIITEHGEPFNRDGWEYILKTYNGWLPVEICALPEGTVVPCGVPVSTVRSLDPFCAWLETYVETALLRAVWYASTVATISHEIKQDITRVMKGTCDNLDKLPFMLHDFGARGSSSTESSYIAGLSHLSQFMGTDTMLSLVAARRYFGEQMAGFSIPAMEHSTVTSWGREGEVDAYRNMLKVYGKPNALLACVSDSYDLENAVDNIWGKELKQEVIDSGAFVVIRPDSGDPKTMVMLTLKLLANNYGYTINSKGYKVLNHVRVLQGDGVNRKSINEIMNAMILGNWSMDNIAFGMGGALHQQCDRDWGRWAMKCSAIKVNGVWRDVFKQPKTDISKSSKRGQFAVDENMHVHNLIGYTGVNLLQPVWRTGKLLRTQTLAEIREISSRG